jgi:hypothetical protein
MRGVRLLGDSMISVRQRRRTGFKLFAMMNFRRTNHCKHAGIPYRIRPYRIYPYRVYARTF